MRTPYPSDLSDREWEILQPLLPSPRRDVRPRKYALREIVNAIRYVQRTGCSWRMLPHDFPPYYAVFYTFHVWRRSGVWQRVHAALHEAVRSQHGLTPQPSAAVADSQSVKTTEKGA